MKQRLYRGFVIILILGLGTYFVNYLIDALSHESTDNAHVTGVIVPVSAEVKGQVVKLHVEDNQHITAGTPLVEIFQDDYVKVLKEKADAVSRLRAEKHELQASLLEKEKALERAKAILDVACAEEVLADKEKRRYDGLLKHKAVSQSHYDNVLFQWKVVQARIEEATAAVAEAEAARKVLDARLTTQMFRIKEAESSRDLAQLELKRTIVTAPVTGRVAKKNVEIGKYVQPGQILLAIVKKDTWIIANFKETQIKKMAVGQPVEVKVDAYPRERFHGHIDSIQPGTGSVFSLLPPENATGNFIKVVQRVPVKIVMESESNPPYPLLPGLSVVASVDVSRGVCSTGYEK